MADDMGLSESTLRGWRSRHWITGQHYIIVGKNDANRRDRGGRMAVANINSSKGIDEHFGSYRIRFKHKGKRYTETHPGDLSKTHLRSAIQRREWLIARLKVGLPIEQTDAAQKATSIAVIQHPRATSRMQCTQWLIFSKSVECAQRGLQIKADEKWLNGTCFCFLDVLIFNLVTNSEDENGINMFQYSPVFCSLNSMRSFE